MAARGRSETPGGDIRAYLTLMYVVERAFDGFLRWAHDEGDAFEPTLSAYMEQIVERQQKKPLLVTAQERMVAVRKILTEKEVTARLGDAATLAACALRAEEELVAALLDAGAAAAEVPCRRDDVPDFHLTLAVPVRYLEERVTAAKRGEKGARRLSDEDLRRALDLLRPVHDERNRVMHGHVPSFLLDSDDGLIDRVSELFVLMWKWLHSTGRRYSDEPFTGFRYLALDRAMLRRITTSGRILSHRLIIDERELDFYEAGHAVCRPKSGVCAATWVSEQPRPRRRTEFETLQKAKDRAAESWLKGAAVSAGTSFPAVPAGAQDDPFGVPFWQPVHRDDPLQHIALLAAPRLRSSAAPRR